jgi:DNA-directed RNA polymerase subunit RPC12/RpoP
MFTQAPMKTVLYKACPRCHGDLLMDEEAEPTVRLKGGIGYVCLQCGRPTVMDSLKSQAMREPDAPVAA